jgi:hypothetical protein
MNCVPFLGLEPFMLILSVEDPEQDLQDLHDFGLPGPLVRGTDRIWITGSFPFLINVLSGLK